MPDDLEQQQQQQQQQQQGEPRRLQQPAPPASRGRSTQLVPSRPPMSAAPSAAQQQQQQQQSASHPLRRGDSILARSSSLDDGHRAVNHPGEEQQHARKRRLKMQRLPPEQAKGGGEGGTGQRERRGFRKVVAGNGPLDGWMVYCWLLTCLVPGVVLRGVFGKRTVDSQRAWREKMGLVSIILAVMGFVGFLTFGFTQAVVEFPFSPRTLPRFSLMSLEIGAQCGTPVNRYRAGTIPTGSLIIQGYTYDLGNWNHPPFGVFNGSTNPLFTDPWLAGGMDASFLFQRVNEQCLGLITPVEDSPIPHEGNRMAWYMPCNLRPQNGTSTVNAANATNAYQCHTAGGARAQLEGLGRQGQVYFDWEDIKDGGRNLAVYKGKVLDLSLVTWLQRSLVDYPALFDEMASPSPANATTWRGLDLTYLGMREGLDREFGCLSDVVSVGFISGESIGCMASEVVLYVSLVFIIGIVAIKFAMAVTFGWLLSWRLASFPGESYAERTKRAQAMENWTEDIYRVAPSRYRPNVSTYAGNASSKKGSAWTMPKTSRFSRVEIGRPGTMYSAPGSELGGGGSVRPGRGMSRSRTESFYYATTARAQPFVLPYTPSTPTDTYSLSSACPWPLDNVISQPPLSYEPFNFPLAQTICLVTAYSETVEGLRTTLDSLATTDYPKSHACILVVADGMVRGSGSDLFTPDIVLGMMRDLIVPADEVEPRSYIAIADGHKKLNQAKVFAGFYDYDDATVEVSKQQRVPIVLVAKVGNAQEASDAKPGNRGKRDSQIVLMAFLQKALFDERMTAMEVELFNAFWRVTGITPDRYEQVLCVDADTKVFPDSITRMSAAMYKDQRIMGLCGETKIANKTETWVTMIQVFEYYISHHSQKGFESVFGGVTCLPGCFSMYRIKVCKGSSDFWIPILASPDIVEAYSENVVDSLHKKNLLLLGEDRYLSTLMLRTFPHRKMMFLPQAVCKTVVPDTFRVLLSQRRRWINSTIHNLFELLFVHNLCGTFCFSMQFVVFVDLVGTLALPAAISFTIYIVVISIIPSQTTPTISLILLALILGLPAVLIVITSRRWIYVGWMLIYLFSLPIWNFVLPVYSYWNMDDFSWGETRKVQGEVSGGTGHGDRDGEFDPSQIVMKRWAEWERERHWQETSRPESYYDLQSA